MSPQFIKKPLTDRLKDTGFLLKNSFTIVGKDKDIAKPTIRMTIITGVIITFVFLSLLTFFTGSYVFLGMLLLLFTIFILLPYRIFFDVKQKASQSWIVYQTVKGNDISYKDAVLHVKTQRSSLTKIAFVDLLVKWTTSQQGRQKGIKGVLIAIFLAALREIWDLLSHYLYPAVVIEGKPLNEIIPEIKSLRDNVPATLTGVFGIDFVGHVVRSMLFPAYFVFLLLGFGIGYIVSLATESTVITIAGISFSWVPVFVMLYIVFLIGGVFKEIVESLKVIYFTLFYIAITRPMDIRAISQEELTHYLLMDKTAAVPKSTTPNPKLEPYIEKYLQQGYRPEQLTEFLVSKGYSANDVQTALQAAQKNAESKK